MSLQVNTLRNRVQQNALVLYKLLLVFYSCGIFKQFISLEYEHRNKTQTYRSKY